MIGRKKTNERSSLVYNLSAIIKFVCRQRKRLEVLIKRLQEQKGENESGLGQEYKIFCRYNVEGRKHFAKDEVQSLNRKQETVY